MDWVEMRIYSNGEYFEYEDLQTLQSNLAFISENATQQGLIISATLPRSPTRDDFALHLGARDYLNATLAYVHSAAKALDTYAISRQSCQYGMLVDAKFINNLLSDIQRLKKAVLPFYQF